MSYQEKTALYIVGMGMNTLVFKYLLNDSISVATDDFEYMHNIYICCKVTIFHDFQHFTVVFSRDIQKADITKKLQKVDTRSKVSCLVFQVHIIDKWQCCLVCICCLGS